MAEFQLTRFETWKSLVQDTAASMGEDGVAQMAAAMSYWLLVTLSSVAFVLSRLASWLLSDSSPLAPTTVDRLRQPYEGVQDIAGGSLAFAGSLAPVIISVLLLVGATAVFREFALAINRVWKVESRGGAAAYIRKNALGLLLLGVFAVGIFVALVLSVFLSRLVDWAAASIVAAGGVVPEFESIKLVSGVGGVLAAWGLFTIAFWIVPARKIRLVDVLPGAALTAIAYQIGVIVLSIWLPTSTRFQIYGVFGFFITAIVFIYYVAYIALTGAEFTRHWVLRAESAREASDAGPDPS